MRKSVIRRLSLTLLFISLFSITVYLILENFRDNLVFFFSPTEMLKDPKKAFKKVRLGGLIKKGSVKIISQENHILQFELSDLNQEITVHYQGFLPDLFREGQGLVAEGYLNPDTHIFRAHTVLAKHDENYKPPELEKVLKTSHGKSTLSEKKLQGKGLK